MLVDLFGSGEGESHQVLGFVIIFVKQVCVDLGEMLFEDVVMDSGCKESPGSAATAKVEHGARFPSF